MNLFLDVRGKRADGYHELATLLVPVSLYDTLEVQPAAGGELHLTCVPDIVPIGPRNLVWKAAEALRRRFGVTSGARMRLTKRIPHEAGLGGGSSNAAAAIAGLNAVWGLNRSVAELLPVAAEVGSDVPGCLVTGATDIPACEPDHTGRNACATSQGAWCTGRGEIVSPVPAGGPIHLVIVKPPVGCPTGEVFKRAVPGEPADPTAVLKSFAVGDAAGVAAGLHNSLQPAAFALQPRVARVYDRLVECEPLGVALSGSGASVFAVCQSADAATAVCRRFLEHADTDTRDCRAFVVRTLGPPI